MRSLVLVALVAVAASAATARDVRAGPSCWGEIVREWVRIGYVRDDHSPRCYREALRRVDEKTDLAVYSDLADSIRSALAASLARAAGKAAPARYVTEVRRATARTTTSSVAAAPRSAATPRVPVPLLVLGGLGGALVVAGAVGGALRRRGASRP